MNRMDRLQIIVNFCVYFCAINSVFSQYLGSRHTDILCATPNAKIISSDGTNGIDSIRIQSETTELVAATATLEGFKSRRSVLLTYKQRLLIPALVKEIYRDSTWKYIDLDVLGTNIPKGSKSAVYYTSPGHESLLRPKKEVTRNGAMTEIYPQYAQLLFELINNYQFQEKSGEVIPTPWNKLIVSAEITNRTLVEVIVKKTQVYKMDISILWEIKDAYGNLLDTINTRALSDPEVVNLKIDLSDKLCMDAIHYNLLIFLGHTKLQQHLKFRIEKLAPVETLIDRKGTQSNDVNSGLNSIVKVTNDDRVSTGTILSKDGFIVTDFSVISGNRDSLAVIINGNKIRTEIVAISEKYNLTLLKIAEEELEYFAIEEKKLTYGDKFYSMCYSNSELLGKYITKGMISNERNYYSHQLYQVDAPFSYGNYGGACINTDGELIGIIVSKVNSIEVEGIGFVMPIQSVLKELNVQLK